MTNTTATSAPEKLLLGWLLLLGALTAIGSLSIDMYLPSFPTIAQQSGVGSNLVQLTLAAFLAGLAVGQMFYGPLSDRFGRKPPLYVGMTLYLLGSLACMVSQDVMTLILFRFRQGLGGCAGMVIGRAVIRDRLGITGAAKAFSLMMGLPAMLSLSVALLMACGVNSLPVLLVGFFGFLASYGFISPNASAIALSQQGKQAGVASALMGTLQFALGITSGISMSLWHDGTTLPLMAVMAICGVGGLLLRRFVARPEHQRLTQAAKA